jgi:hypothetical protein
MANESILWYIQVKEESYQDNEMAHRSCLCSALLDQHSNYQ